MRPSLAAACLAVSAPLASACFEGGDALGLPCEKNSQCGDGQSCSPEGMCIGKGDDGTGNDDDGSSDDTSPIQPCDPSPPPYCMLGTELGSRSVAFTELERTDFGHATAIVTGDFVGDDKIDLAVLNMVEHQLHMVSNDGEANYMIAGTWFDPLAPQTFDVISPDMDCDGDSEFFVLSFEAGTVTQLEWNETDAQFDAQAQLSVVANNLYSLAAADLVQDDNQTPDLLILGNSQIHLVANYGGALDPGGAVTVGEPSGTEFLEPWASVIVGGTLEDARILVPQSNDGSFMGEANQLVHSLQATTDIEGFPLLQKAEPPTLASDFRNPFAIAAGNFDGDPGDTIEIAVAERNLTGGNESTDEPGRLRFFRFVDDAPVEVVDGGIMIGVGPRALAAADLDCDGRDDLVIGHTGRNDQYDGVPQVMFGADPLSDMTPEDVPVGGMSSGTRIGIGDFDGDGRPEVAIPDWGRDNDEPGNRIVFIDVEEES